MTASLGRARGGPLSAWLEALEKDFDKTFVDLDVLLGDIDAVQVNISIIHWQAPSPHPGPPLSTHPAGT